MLFSYDADLLPKLRMVGRILYSRPWQHFYRCIDEYILYVIKNGNMFIKENNKEYHLKSGDFFILEPGQEHVGYKKAICEYYYVHFQHPGIQRTYDETMAMRDIFEKRRKSMMSYNLDSTDPTDSITYIPKFIHLSKSDYSGFFNTMIHYYDEREEHYKRRSAACLHSFFLQVSHLHLFAVGTEKGDRLNRSDLVVEQLLRYLNHHYREKIMSSDISNKFDMNYDYLNRVFTKLTGRTIILYTNQLRINEAQHLIQSTDLQFAEIADFVGIKDRYYFSKLFKKMTGMSPTEYFKHVRENKNEQQ